MYELSSCALNFLTCRVIITKPLSITLNVRYFCKASYFIYINVIDQSSDEETYLLISFLSVCQRIDIKRFSRLERNLAFNFKVVVLRMSAFHLRRICWSIDNNFRVSTRAILWNFFFG